MNQQTTEQRAEWMSQGSFGIMVHWLYPGIMPEQGEPHSDLNSAVDAFKAEEFVRQVFDTGADWLIFTLGQNTGYYVSSNAVLDRLAGPGHTSNRDLALEIATLTAQRGKRFVGYLPAEVEGQEEKIQRAFEWDLNDPTQARFQVRYTEFLSEYARKFGSLLSGWWFDGCFTWKAFPNKYYNWPLWASAARAGNPQAALAFNDSTFLVPDKLQPLTPEQDYMAGEIEVIHEGKVAIGMRKNNPTSSLFMPNSKYASGSSCLWHALAYIDADWMHQVSGPMEQPLYSNENLFSFVRDFKAVGGAVTLNIGIYEDGRMGDATRAQLEQLSHFLAKHR